MGYKVYQWRTKGKEKGKPTVDKKVLQKFAPKYVKELVSEEDFDITELFDTKRKHLYQKENLRQF